MRIVIFNSDSEARRFNSDPSIVPVVGFEGTYSVNEIPYPLYFSKRNCLVGKEILIDNGEYFIAFDLMKLVRVESMGEGTYIYMDDGSYWQSELNIEYFDRKLKGKDFFRIQMHHLVNLAFMERVVSCSAFVTLGNHITLPVDPGKDIEIIKYLENKKII